MVKITLLLRRKEELMLHHHEGYLEVIQVVNNQFKLVLEFQRRSLSSQLESGKWKDQILLSQFSLSQMRHIAQHLNAIIH